MLMIRLSLALLLVPSSATAAPPKRPTRVLLPVPQFTEVTGLNCGPASLQSVFNYFGPDVSQREIADVARTSSIGTYVYDMVRAGHFSTLSAAQGRFFPHDVPLAGYTTRGLGYAAFGHAQATPWLDQLKDLLVQGVPSVLLMLYTPEPNSGGHYRVLVGYDDQLGVAYFVDPWGRDLKRQMNPDGTVTWTYADLIRAWTYSEYGTSQPYFAATLLPWEVNLSARRSAGKVIIDATATYPCFAPFNCQAYPASDTTLSLSLPEGWRLEGGSSTVAVGTLQGGATTAASWKLVPPSGATAAPVTVTASGVVSGQLPAALWTGGEVSYPPYAYRDRIGGSGSISVSP